MMQAGRNLIRYFGGVNNPVGIAYDAAGDRFAVANYGANNVLLLDASTGLVTATYTGFANASTVAFDPTDNTILWVATDDVNSSLAKVYTLDLTTGTKTEKNSVSGGTYRSIVIDAPNNRLYISNFSANNIEVRNYSTYALISNTTVTAAMAMALDTATGKLYVAQHNQNKVSVLNATTMALTATIQPTGGDAFSTAYGLCLSGNYLLVTNNSARRLTLLDKTSGAVIRHENFTAGCRGIVAKGNYAYTAIANPVSKIGTLPL